ncbi:hypothetical protein B0H13DRAFT_2664011, partial [Mycena leptocephala]
MERTERNIVISTYCSIHPATILSILSLSLHSSSTPPPLHLFSPFQSRLAIKSKSTKPNESASLLRYFLHNFFFPLFVSVSVFPNYLSSLPPHSLRTVYPSLFCQLSTLYHISSFFYKLQVYHDDDYTFGFRAQLAITTTTLGPCLDRITFSLNTPSILEKHSSRLVSNHVLVFYLVSPLYFLFRSGMNYCV